MAERRVAVGPRTYRLLDVATKVLGVTLVAAGLEVGGGTAAGLLLGACGTALALLTVFIGRQQ